MSFHVLFYYVMSCYVLSCLLLIPTPLLNPPLTALLTTLSLPLLYPSDESKMDVTEGAVESKLSCPVLLGPSMSCLVLLCLVLLSPV
jgi:hypothetical protein